MGNCIPLFPANNGRKILPGFSATEIKDLRTFLAIFSGGVPCRPAGEGKKCYLPGPGRFPGGPSLKSNNFIMLYRQSPLYPHWAEVYTQCQKLPLS